MIRFQKFILTGVSVLFLSCQPAKAMNETGELTPVGFVRQNALASTDDARAGTAALAAALPEAGNVAIRATRIAELIAASPDSQDPNRLCHEVRAVLERGGVNSKTLAFIWEVLRMQLPSSAAAASSGSIDRPLASHRVIPEIARGYEDIYLRFLNGKLIYRPTEGSDEGMVVLPIADLANPLGGEFDLRNCGDTGRSLSIATGYRKVQNQTNANKLEMWFAPRFLVDKELPNMAANHHLRSITTAGGWDAARAPVGIFWTWGNWDAAYNMQHCDYLTSESMEELGTENLYKKWQKSRWAAQGGAVAGCRGKISHYVFELK